VKDWPPALGDAAMANLTIYDQAPIPGIVTLLSGLAQTAKKMIEQCYRSLPCQSTHKTDVVYQASLGHQATGHSTSRQ